MTVSVDLVTMLVNIVSRRGDVEVVDHNIFVRKKAHRHFYFAIPEGWMGVKPMVGAEEM